MIAERLLNVLVLTQEVHPLESHYVAVSLSKRDLLLIGKVVDNRHYKFAFLLVKTNFVNNMNLQCRPQLAEYERCHFWRYRRAMLNL